MSTNEVNGFVFSLTGKGVNSCPAGQCHRERVAGETETGHGEKARNFGVQILFFRWQVICQETWD